MNLKDRAITARMERREYDAEKETAQFAERVKVTEVVFHETFGEHCPVAPGTCDVVLVDGLRLRAVFTRTFRRTGAIDSFQLWGTCPECGADCYSKSICNLVDLGEQIENFEAGFPHKCTSTHIPTVGETLLEALQDFICEIE